MSSKCIWGQCGREATYQIGVHVWALQTPMILRNQGNCIKMLTSVTVCEECSSKLKVADFLLPEGKERIASGLARAGRAEPDFANAKLDLVEIIDEPIDLDKFIPPGAKVIKA